MHRSAVIQSRSWSNLARRGPKLSVTRPERPIGPRRPCVCCTAPNPNSISDPQSLPTSSLPDTQPLSTNVPEDSSSPPTVESVSSLIESKAQETASAVYETQSTEPAQAKEVEEAVATVEPRNLAEEEDVQEREVSTGESVSSEFSRFDIDVEKVQLYAKVGAGVLLGTTFLVAVLKTVRKFLSPKAQRKRTVNKNRELIEELMKYLPAERESLTSKVVLILKMKTGFSSTEVFRKYLWFLLRERKFDQEAVDDVIHLKGALGMTDEDVAAALKERAQRIYDKYGTLMLNTEGMTGAGIERKATCRALFSKMLYLTEQESLLDPNSEAFQTADLRGIFGATDGDVDDLRIVSLQEMDLDVLDRMASEGEGGEDAEDSKVSSTDGQ